MGLFKKTYLLVDDTSEFVNISIERSIISRLNITDIILEMTNYLNWDNFKESHDKFGVIISRIDPESGFDVKYRIMTLHQFDNWIRSISDIL